MNITLIGMSGCGKTHWSKQLEKKGFKRFGVDDLIEQKLEKELTALGFKGIHDVAKWMGYPYDDRYPAASKKYLELEKEVMQEIIAFIKSPKANSENIVIDTTGSVIYTGDEILRELSLLSTVIYLKVPETYIKDMYTTFLRDPKPILWGDLYRKNDNETNLKALKRCYSDLLTYRTKQYEKIARKIMDINSLKDNTQEVDTLFLS